MVIVQYAGYDGTSSLADRLKKGTEVSMDV